MFGLDIKKAFGAIVAVCLAVVVIGYVGDFLVHPRKHEAAAVAVAHKEPAAPKEEEKAVPFATLLASADAAAGKKVSGKCKSCHDLTDKEKLRIGPPLWNIVGADKGRTDKFSYSSAVKDVGGKWTYNDLDHFLASPKDFLKGTKMAFPGVKNAKDRANLIAYLRTLSSDPKPLPQ